MSIFPLPYFYEADKADFDYWGILNEDEEPYMKK